MLTTDPSSGRVIRWVPISTAIWMVAVAAFSSAAFSDVRHALRPESAALRDTREELARTRHECKQAISLTEELITNLEGWMQFAHSTEHGAD